ncbi:MAG: hypothetical protein AUJ34_02470 [Parcubacteria group bacterium CG1_02_41_12]|nr:MAG: hypothetical protein AUJ34_02470 [Parcubacteria group bacterium CG1_02_41_12]
MHPKVQIQIVTWNSSKHLERLFTGIEKQEGVDFEVVIIDNASEDGTKDEILRLASLRACPEYSEGMTINRENRGFAAGHNQGFEMCKAPYVLILNPDTELQENFLRETVDMIESESSIASVGGVLYQQLPEPPLNPPLNTGGEIYRYGVIDSLGLKMRINGQIVDIGQNCPQNANLSPKTDVFGITGACVLYRLSALKSVKDQNGIFDERFHSYKEDADLAWRLHNAGFKAKIATKAIAYHGRQIKEGDRRNKSDRIKFLSIRNHLLMLKKNLDWRDWWRVPFIIAYELLKFIYIAIFETQNSKAYKILWTSQSSS